MRWLAAAHRHPRHTILFAATAGLLLGPVSRPATLAVALALAVSLAVLARPASPAPGAPLALAAALALMAGALAADLRLASL